MAIADDLSHRVSTAGRNAQFSTVAVANFKGDTQKLEEVVKRLETSVADLLVLLPARSKHSYPAVVHYRESH